MAKTEKYVHTGLNEDVVFISGSYEIEEEVRFEYGGREVFYAVGQGVLDGTCCGVGGCRYALVPGYVISWKREKNEDGLPVSEVEPSTDQNTQTAIRQMIKEKEVVTHIMFR